MICEDQSLLLDALTPAATYLWSDNSTESQLLVSNEGIYSVNVVNQCGEDQDEIVIENPECIFPCLHSKWFVPNGTR